MKLPEKSTLFCNILTNNANNIITAGMLNIHTSDH